MFVPPARVSGLLTTALLLGNPRSAVRRVCTSSPAPGRLGSHSRRRRRTEQIGPAKGTVGRTTLRCQRLSVSSRYPLFAFNVLSLISEFNLSWLWPTLPIRSVTPRESSRGCTMARYEARRPVSPGGIRVRKSDVHQNCHTHERVMAHHRVYSHTSPRGGAPASGRGPCRDG